MSFLRTFLESNASQLLSNVFQLITSILIARYLGPSGKGAYSSTIAIEEIILYLFLFGIGNGILYSASKRKSEIKKINFHASFLSIISGVLASGVIVLLSLTENPIVKNLNPVYLLLISPLPLIAIWFSNFNYFLMSQEKYRLVYFLSWFSSALQLVFIIFAIVLGKLNIYTAFIILISANAIPLLIQLAYAYRTFGISFGLNKEIIKEIFFISRKSYFISLMIYIIVRSDLIILNSIRGNYETGIYSISAALASKMLILTSPITAILAPKAIRDLKSQIEFQKKVFRNLLFFFTGLIVLADILYIPAVKILYGQQFVKSFSSFLILNPGILFFSLVNSISPYFLAKGIPLISLISPLASATLNIVLNLILIPYFGYNAAAFTSSLSYFLHFSLLTWYFIREEKVALRELFVPQKDEILYIFKKLASRLGLKFNHGS